MNPAWSSRANYLMGSDLNFGMTLAWSSRAHYLVDSELENDQILYAFNLEL